MSCDGRQPLRCFNQTLEVQMQYSAKWSLRIHINTPKIYDEVFTTDSAFISLCVRNKPHFTRTLSEVRSLCIHIKICNHIYVLFFCMVLEYLSVCHSMIKLSYTALNCNINVNDTFLQVTPWIQVLFEKPSVAQTLENLAKCYGTRWFITVFSTAFHRSFPERDQSSLYHPTLSL
jgi:hypothetical protein